MTPTKECMPQARMQVLQPVKSSEPTEWASPLPQAKQFQPSHPSTLDTAQRL